MCIYLYITLIIYQCSLCIYMSVMDTGYVVRACYN